MNILTRTEMRTKAKRHLAFALSWPFLGAVIVESITTTGFWEVPIALAVMAPFVWSARTGVDLWFRAKSAPDLPHARLGR